MTALIATPTDPAWLPVFAAGAIAGVAFGLACIGALWTLKREGWTWRVVLGWDALGTYDDREDAL